MTLYFFLQKYYKFDSWHIRPIEFREYAMAMVLEINHMLDRGVLDRNGQVVEIGCGLGEIVKNINCKNWVGFDKSNKVLKCAKLLSIDKKNVRFIYGSFENIRNESIEIVIAVNFIHEIDPIVLKGMLTELIEKIL